jgi:6-phosphogluconolactonase (cycloisomerase 2 family)
VSIGVVVAQAAVGNLAFLDAQVNGQGGVTGLASTYDVAVSPNGKNVYATGSGDDAVVTFKRNRDTGKLKFLNEKVDGQGGVDGLNGASDIAVSPNGDNVYVTGNHDNAVVTFRRNHRSGKLKFVNEKVDGQGGVDGLMGPHVVRVSPDARNVYVEGYSDDSIAIFKRNLRSGKLKFLNAKFNGVGDVQGIATPFGMSISPHGDNVYATGEEDDAIVTFKRKPHTGNLKFVNEKVNGTGGIEGLDSPDEPALSPDAKNVYVASDASDSIATFKRNRRSGKLQFVNAKFDGQDGVDGLDSTYDSGVSRDGDNVYAVGYSDNAVATFRRRDNGTLEFLNVRKNGVNGVSDLAGAFRLALSPDDHNLYVAAYDDSAVVTFHRHG